MLITYKLNLKQQKTGWIR